MKAMKFRPEAILGGMMLVSVGCTHVYSPRESNYKTENIPMFTASSKVALLNNQPDTTEVLYAENMGHDFMANLNEWTEKAIGITERELKERGAESAARNDKKLWLKVNSVSVTTGGWGFRGILILEACTGDGVAKQFKGEAPAANLYNASSGCLSAAVGVMLSDPAFVAYLSQ